MSPPKFILQFPKNSGFALLAGAGISINSKIPGCNGIIKILKEQYPEKLKQNSQYNYDEAFNFIWPGLNHCSDRRRFFEDLIAGKNISLEHKKIAHLVNRGFFNVIFTPNFDHFIELSLLGQSSRPFRVHLYDEDAIPSNYVDTMIHIFKLHGDFLFDDLANFPQEMVQRINKNMWESFHYYLTGKSLIILGFSGRDDSIMNILYEMADNPYELNQGIWWVIHNNDDLKNPKLQFLIAKLQQNNKKFSIVGPTDAISFLDEIIYHFDFGEPENTPFGIGLHNHINFYSSIYNKSRQIPPHSNGEQSEYFEQKLNELNNALEKSKTVILTGKTGSGKTSLIAQLCSKWDPKKIFYFNPRFSDTPIALELRDALRDFANNFDIELLKSEDPNEIVNFLLSKNCLLIFDDFFPYDSIFEFQFRTDRQIKNNKNIPINLPSLKDIEIPTPQLQLESPHQISLNHSNPILKRNLSKSYLMKFYKTSSPKTRKVLELMCALHHAEYADILSILSDVEDIEQILNTFLKMGIAESNYHKFALREKVVWTYRNNNIHRRVDILKIGETYENLAETKNFHRRIHFFLEAEGHYWISGKHDKSLKVWLKIVNYFYLKNYYEYIWTNLKDHFELKTNIFNNLSALDRIRLVNLFRSSKPNPNVDDLIFIHKVENRIFSSLDKGCWLYYQAISKGSDDPFAFFYYLREAEEFLNSGEIISQMLAETQLLLPGAIIKMHIDNPYRLYDEDQKSNFQEALAWAKKAETSFNKLKDNKGALKAKSETANVYLVMKKYKKALNIWNDIRSPLLADAGFTDEKGILYGNLFFANLFSLPFENCCKDAAEGYFYESNLNFTYINKLYRVHDHFIKLFFYIAFNNPKDLKISRIIDNLYRLLMEISENIQEEKNLCIFCYWFIHNFRNNKIELSVDAALNYFKTSKNNNSINIQLSRQIISGIIFPRISNSDIRESFKNTIYSLIENESPELLTFYHLLFENHLDTDKIPSVEGKIKEDCEKMIEKISKDVDGQIKILFALHLIP